MSEFKTVTVIKEANIYFEGRVNSRTVLFADGSKKTLGFMLPGEYKFNTQFGEIMEFFSGTLEVQIADSKEWKKVKGGESFEVPASSQFTVKILTPSDYCCSFLE